MLKTHASKPQWQELFRIYCAHLTSNVIFTIKYRNLVRATLIERVHTSIENLVKSKI